MTEPGNKRPDDDLELFRAAVRDAVPLRASPRHHAVEKPLPPIPVQSLLDEHDALAESLAEPFALDDEVEGAEDESYLRPGLARDVLRKMRRGTWRVQRELDLHGRTSIEAHELLTQFLRDCLKHGVRCVRVIHGKGLGSKNRLPVLKGKVKAWLARRQEVLAYCQAPPAQGGGGALLVLLKG